MFTSNRPLLDDSEASNGPLPFIIYQHVRKKWSPVLFIKRLSLKQWMFAFIFLSIISFVAFNELIPTRLNRLVLIVFRNLSIQFVFFLAGSECRPKSPFVAIKPILGQLSISLFLSTINPKVSQVVNFEVIAKFCFSSTLSTLDWESKLAKFSIRSNSSKLWLFVKQMCLHFVLFCSKVQSGNCRQESTPADQQRERQISLDCFRKSSQIFRPLESRCA